MGLSSRPALYCPRRNRRRISRQFAASLTVNCMQPAAAVAELLFLGRQLVGGEAPLVLVEVVDVRLLGAADDPHGDQPQRPGPFVVPADADLEVDHERPAVVVDEDVGLLVGVAVAHAAVVDVAEDLRQAVEEPRRRRVEVVQRDRVDVLDGVGRLVDFARPSRHARHAREPAINLLLVHAQPLAVPVQRKAPERLRATELDDDSRNLDLVGPLGLVQARRGEEVVLEDPHAADRPGRAAPASPAAARGVRRAARSCCVEAYRVSPCDECNGWACFVEAICRDPRAKSSRPGHRRLRHARFDPPGRTFLRHFRRYSRDLAILGSMSSGRVCPCRKMLR